LQKRQPPKEAHPRSQHKAAWIGWLRRLFIKENKNHTLLSPQALVAAQWKRGGNSVGKRWAGAVSVHGFSTGFSPGFVQQNFHGETLFA
jgi:hypothetical protein